MKNDKANGSIVFIGLLWSINALHLVQNDSIDCLKPLTLSAVGNNDRMFRSKFAVVCKCPGGRDTSNCQMPGRLLGMETRTQPVHVYLTSPVL